MYRETPEYKDWKAQADSMIEELVVQRFERLYHAGGRLNYNMIWGEINREVHERFGLLTEEIGDVEKERQEQQRHYLSVAITIYAESEFPHELNDARTFRFVKQFGKLPSQAPEDWAGFEIDQRLAEARRREAKDASIDEYIRLRDAGPIHSP